MEEQMPDKTVYLVGGIGCSGKSTFSRKLAQDKQIPYFKADDVYLIVANNLKISPDKLVYAPMESTWEHPEVLGIPDFGIYGSMKECVKSAYLEYFSYNIPQSFVMEGEALYWNVHERDMIQELLSERQVVNLCVYPDYERWLKNRTKRKHDGGHLPDFRDEDEYNKLYEEYLSYTPERTILVKDAMSECSPMGGTNYQADDFSTPKWSVFNFPENLNGKTFLDISCNTGWFSKMAADRGAKVTGFDISWQVLVEAQKRVPEGLFKLSKVEDFNFGFYDYILCSSAFHYYTHREDVIRRISESTTYFVLELPLLNSPDEDIEYQDSYLESFCALPSEKLLMKWLKKYFKDVEKIGETIQPNSPNRSVYRCTQ
jgi:2-polyprenyl-3-methyl-5-hydroxy-6-metoxy-1,4-benzoquinol methylase